MNRNIAFASQHLVRKCIFTNRMKFGRRFLIITMRYIGTKTGYLQEDHYQKPDGLFILNHGILEEWISLSKAYREHI